MVSNHMLTNSQGEMFRHQVITKVINIMISRLNATADAPIDLTTQTPTSSNVFDLTTSPQERARIPTDQQNIFAESTIQPTPP